MKKILCASFFLYSSFIFAGPWEDHSNPLKLDRSFSVKFDETLVFGEKSDPRTAWPGSHWSNWLGGVAHRWSSSDTSFYYKLNSLAELRELYPHELEELSATEKMDIYRGDYNYSITRRELGRVSPKESKWHGICHGYAPAAIHHPEPQTVELINKDGIKLHFYSSDVAGLLSLYYAEFAKTPVQFVGKRCRSSRGVRVWNRGSCAPLNAGSFHIGLTNKLALRGESLVFDIEPGPEVWNFVVDRFYTKYISSAPVVSTSSKKAVKRILVQTEVIYASDIAPKFDPVLFTEHAYYVNRWHEYYLEIDKDNNIVGGEWVTDNGPDFMWSQDKAEFKGVWETLNEIYVPIDFPSLEEEKQESL